MTQEHQSPRLVDKIAGVLNELGASGQASAADIAEVLDEPRSSIYRLLGQLESLGWVERTSERGQWRLGIELFRLGAQALEGRELRAVARPYMANVHEATEETVFLLVRRGIQAVCIDTIDGRYVRSLALRLGGTIELHAGAGPRSLLAFASPSVRESWRQSLVERPLMPRTEHSLRTVEAIEEELELVRQQGYATSDQDVTPGIAAVGVPVFGFDGEPVAALSVSGIREVVMNPERRVVDILREAGQAISSDLGHRPGRGHDIPNGSG